MHRVASGQDFVAAIIAPVLDQSMRKEPSLPQHKHNVPGMWPVGGGVLNHKHVSGPNRRQHTPSGNLQSQHSRRPQHIRRELRFDVMCFVE